MIMYQKVCMRGISGVCKRYGTVIYGVCQVRMRIRYELYKAVERLI